MAYRRIISERQNSHDGEQCNIITRWSTPPKFGLSPPGNSRLARRRSLKNKLKPLSSPAFDIYTGNEKIDSLNNTPVQSPDIQFLIEEEFHDRIMIQKSHSPEEDEKTVKDGRDKRGCFLKL